MNKKKILMVNDNSLDVIGGSEESTKIILYGLNEKFDFTVVHPGESANKINNINYLSYSGYKRLKQLVKKPILFLRYIIYLKKEIDILKPNIIHTQGQASFFIVSILKKLRLIKIDIPLVHTERGLYVKYNNFYKKIFLNSINELNTLVATTNFNLKFWKDAIEKKNININYEVIPNTAGHIFEKYDITKESKNDGKFTVGFSGRYNYVKNWPLAVDIIKMLSDLLGTDLNVKIAIGVVTREEEKKASDLFISLKELLGNRFEGKINIPIEEMNEFYYDIDLFILTSLPNGESFGRTLVEAMSRKTAVITTNSGGSEEVVGNKKNICYSLNEIVSRAEYFYNNPSVLEKEKNDNLNRVRKYYSHTLNINSYKVLYEKILK